MRKRLAAAVLIPLLGLAPASAAGLTGCGNFKWPVTRERALLTTSDLPNLASGVDAPTLPPLAAKLALRPVADAGLPKPSERTRKPGTFAGFLRLGQIPAGTYTVSVSDYAWIDVLQNGSSLRPMDISEASGCDGIQRVLRFDLAAGSTTIQVGSVAANTIRLAVTPSSD